MRDVLAMSQCVLWESILLLSLFSRQGIQCAAFTAFPAALITYSLINGASQA